MPLSTLGLPCVLLRRPTLATRVRCAARLPSRRSRDACASASSCNFTDVARSSWRAQHRRELSLHRGFDGVRHQVRAQGLGLVGRHRFLDQHALEQVVHRAVGRRRARRGSRRLLRSPRTRPAAMRIGEQARRRASRRRAPVRAPRTGARRARDGRRARRRARRRAVAAHVTGRPRRCSPRDVWRATVSRRRSASMSSSPASFITY